MRRREYEVVDLATHQELIIRPPQMSSSVAGDSDAQAKYLGTCRVDEARCLGLSENSGRAGEI